MVTLITRRDTKAELADARDKLHETRLGVDRTLDQVANTHDTNLRDDLDGKFSELGDRLAIVADALGAMREDVGGLHSETRDLRRDVLGIRTDARRDRRKLAEQEKKLDEHLSDVPRIIDELLDRHVGDCPLRTTE